MCLHPTVRPLPPSRPALWPTRSSFQDGSTDTKASSLTRRSSRALQRRDSRTSASTPSACASRGFSLLHPFFSGPGEDGCKSPSSLARWVSSVNKVELLQRWGNLTSRLLASVWRLCRSLLRLSALPSRRTISGWYTRMLSRASWQKSCTLACCVELCSA
jgi:hypothetical protein